MARRSLVWLMAALVGGCTSETVAPVPAVLGVAIQPSPAARSGVPFERQPAIQVRDAAGAAVAARSVLVTATVQTGAGRLIGTSTARTDDNGLATFVDLGLSGTLGSNVIQFAATGLASATAEPVTLGAGEATTLESAAGNGQVAPAGTALAVRPAVRAKDAEGNPVPGVAIAFEVVAGGGGLAAATATTGTDGVATSGEWTLGPVVGLNRLRASAGSFTVEFGATGTVGAAAKLTLAEGGDQSAIIGALLPVAPAVLLTDAFDNPVAGAQVTFGTADGGTVTGGTAQTDASGVARPGSWTLGLGAGAQVITATRAGLPAVAITATALAFEVGALAVGGVSTCALAGSTGYCWGDNGLGQLGDGTQLDRSVPTAVGGGVQFASIVVGAGHACGVATDGTGYCWGDNFAGQLGDGSTGASLAPKAIGGGHQWASLVAGDFHTCGIDLAGAAWCWGGNGNGRLGDGTVLSRVLPVAVAGGGVYTALAAGNAHTCGIQDPGRLFCWGAGANGRLGIGTTTEQRVPVEVVIAGATFGQVATGGAHTCARTGAGALFCWGTGANGVLGNGDAVQRTLPTPVAGTDTYSAVAAGSAHSCAIRTGGGLFCWGSNGSGRLGDGTPTTRLVPTAVATGVGFASVVAAFEHTCARTIAGAAVCWGGGSQGQIGDGGSILRPRPIGVARP